MEMLPPVNILSKDPSGTGLPMKENPLQIVQFDHFHRFRKDIRPE